MKKERKRQYPVDVYGIKPGGIGKIVILTPKDNGIRKSLEDMAKWSKTDE